MYRSYNVLLILLLSTTFASGQVNFYNDIQPVIQKNCTPCHRPDGAAPFSLLTYEDVAKRAKFIGKVTQSRYMPPFPADRDFQEYLNERGLTNSEITLIQQWINDGLEEGKKVASKSLSKETKTLSRKPDLTVKMNANYQIEGHNKDDFRYFSLPTNLPEDKFIESIRFVPGNRKLVHHSRLMVDTTNAIRAIDGLSEIDPRIRDFQKIALKDDFLYGWVPGNDQITFPQGTGRKLNANADLILNMHYAPTPIAATDQSEVQFFFVDSVVNREVQTLILREDDISNQPFLLPKETKPTFYISKTIAEDISLISILPHMHLLGKSIRAFAVTPDSEVINLIKIDKWDFNWQMTYQFKKFLKIPANSVILVEATYDNTSANPANPNQPAQDVGYGWGTKDEMLNLVMYYVPYYEGDELIEQTLFH